MKKIIRLTESDLTNIVKRVIKENKESIEREARITLSRLGYSYSVLKHYSTKDYIDSLKQASKDRSNSDQFDELINKLKSYEKNN